MAVLGGPGAVCVARSGDAEERVRRADPHVDVGSPSELGDPEALELGQAHLRGDRDDAVDVVGVGGRLSPAALAQIHRVGET